MNTESIINYLSNILPLENGEIDAIKKVFKERRIKRKQFILHAPLHLHPALDD